jgi:hypothetical protein
MKRSRCLDRGYERLTANERFRLLVAAEARADGSEVERLLRSCPQRTFHLRDPAVTDRMQRSFELTAAIVAELHAIAGKIAAIDAVEHAARILFTAAADEAEYEAYRISNRAQPAVGRAVRRERGHLRRMLRQLRRALLSDGAAVAHAFAAVCRDELEVEPQLMIAAAAAPFAVLFDQFINEAVDADALTAMRAELSDAWRTGIGAVPEGERGETN